MPFDDPIYLDRDSFEELMVDTDEHRPVSYTHLTLPTILLV